jgi:hypothetical protein
MIEEDWLADAKIKLDRMPEQAKKVRERAREDLFFFAQLVNKGYMYGKVHEEIFAWMQDYTLFGTGTDTTNNKLIMKSRCCMYLQPQSWLKLSCMLYRTS